MAQLDKIQEVFSRVFSDCPKINPGTKKEDIASWDSMAHLMLILELESEFKIKFSIEQIENLKSVEKIIEALDKK